MLPLAIAVVALTAHQLWRAWRAERDFRQRIIELESEEL